jgi:hypothetical protein
MESNVHFDGPSLRADGGSDQFPQHCALSYAGFGTEELWEKRRRILFMTGTVTARTCSLKAMGGWYKHRCAAYVGLPCGGAF